MKSSIAFLWTPLIDDDFERKWNSIKMPLRSLYMYKMTAIAKVRERNVACPEMLELAQPHAGTLTFRDREPRKNYNPENECGKLA